MSGRRLRRRRSSASRATRSARPTGNQWSDEVKATLKPTLDATDTGRMNWKAARVEEMPKELEIKLLLTPDEADGLVDALDADVQMLKLDRDRRELLRRVADSVEEQLAPHRRPVA